MRKLLTILPLAIGLAVVPCEAADHGKGKELKRYGKKSREWRHGSQGHFPHDTNGDGIVDRREWPGNDEAFLRLDRNRDGVLSARDRELQGQSRFYREGQRRR